MKIWVGVIATLGLFSGSSFAEQTLSSRADSYDRFFFPSGAQKDYLDVRIFSLPKLRQLMTVLPGTLYRAGGAGGEVQLTGQALQGLCEAGFSLAIYAYSTPFTPVAPVQCTNRFTGRPNTLEYIAGDANTMSFKTTVLKRIKAVIDDPSLGPVLVHCWNGFHASGELAAVSLRQFCGWSGPAATAYWLRHSGGFPAISRIDSFVPNVSLDISNEQRAVLCRQQE